MILQNIELYNNIPDELKHLKQWSVIKPNEKRPCNPNGHYSSPTDSATWSSFDNCLEAVKSGDYVGLGFNLSANTHYAVIDLDFEEWQQPTQDQNEIANYFKETYQEISKSGNGLHIVCKTNNSFEGKRKSELGVELYSQERFIIFTGNVINKKPVVDCTPKLSDLWVHLGGTNNESNVPTVVEYQPETLSDDQVVKLVLSGEDGEKWKDLASDGNWQGKYPSQSEADQALMNRIAYFSKNENQTKRLFLLSALGKRDKAKRIDYLESTIKKAFANINKYELPKIDISAIQNQIKNDIQAANDSAHESDLLDLNNLLHIAKTSPDIEFTIPLLTPKGEITLLSANGGVGKSYFALQTAIALVTGTKFFDLPSDKHDLYGLQPSKKCLFVTAEDSKEICAKRLQTICNSQPFEQTRFNNFKLLEMNGKLLWLEDKNKQGVPTPYMNELEMVINKEKPEQVFIDNVSSVFAGNHNDIAQVTLFINHLRKIAKKANCNILLLGHVNADNATKGTTKNYYGSVAWNNALRSRIYMKLESDNLGKYISVIHEKSNYGELHECFKLKRNNKNGLLSLFSNAEIAHTIDNNISNLADELFEDMKVMHDKKENLYTATTGPKTFYNCLSNAFPDKYKEGDKQMLSNVKSAINKLKGENRILKRQIKNGSRNNVEVWIPTFEESA